MPEHGPVFYLFNAAVGLTFLLQIVNYHWFGLERKHNTKMGEPHRYLYITVLSGFALTEAYISLYVPMYWCHVALRIWGITNLIRKQQVQQ